MKNIILFLFSLCIFQTIQGQDEMDKNLLQLGVTTGIFGSTLLSESKPMTVNVPLFLGTTYIHGNLLISPFYNPSDHSIGGFLAYQLNEDLSTYVVVDDAIDEDFGIMGLGIMTPIINPYIQGFVEYTRSYGAINEGGISIGIWAPLNKTVLSW